MPRILPKQKESPDPDAIYVAWQSIASVHYDQVIKRGERLRGDHPVVVHHFANFVADGTPRNEWPSEWDHVVANPPVNDDRPLAYIPPRIPDAEAAVAVEAFSSGLSGAYVAKGQRLRRDDPVVQGNKELFRTPPMPIE